MRFAPPPLQASNSYTAMSSPSRFKVTIDQLTHRFRLVTTATVASVTRRLRLQTPPALPWKVALPPRPLAAIRTSGLLETPTTIGGGRIGAAALGTLVVLRTNPSVGGGRRLLALRRGHMTIQRRLLALFRLLGLLTAFLRLTMPLPLPRLPPLLFHLMAILRLLTTLLRRRCCLLDLPTLLPPFAHRHSAHLSRLGQQITGLGATVSHNHLLIVVIFCLLTCSHERFVVLSYNILADYLARDHRSKLYFHIPQYILDWEWRKRRLLLEFRLWAPDIMCLQEVDRFYDLEEELATQGYAGIWKMRTGDAVDGCAIFWRTNRFQLKYDETIEFNRLGLRDNVAQICVLESQSSVKNESASLLNSSDQLRQANQVVVCNIHVLYNPKRGEIKLGQSPLYNFIAEQKLIISGLARDQISGQYSACISSSRPYYGPGTSRAQPHMSGGTEVNCKPQNKEENQYLTKEAPVCEGTSNGLLDIPQISSESRLLGKTCTVPDVATNKIGGESLSSESCSADDSNLQVSNNTCRSCIQPSTDQGTALEISSIDQCSAGVHSDMSRSMIEFSGSKQNAFDESNDDYESPSFQTKKASDIVAESAAQAEKTSSETLAGTACQEEHSGSTTCLDISYCHNESKPSVNDVASLSAEFDSTVNLFSNSLENHNSVDELENLCKEISCSEENSDPDFFRELLGTDDVCHFGDDPATSGQNHSLDSSVGVRGESLHGAFSLDDGFERRSYDPYLWTPVEIEVASGSAECNFLEHCLKLRSIYTDVEDYAGTKDTSREPQVTSYNRQFMGTVDYIWSSEGLQTAKVLETFPKHVLQQTSGFPTKRWGSDHVALACELAFTNGSSTE
ncbi:unnamed protein product [Musa textilis]